MRSQSRSLLAALLAAAMLLPWVAQTTYASCNPGRANNHFYYWDGRSQSQAGVTDVYSQIYNYTPYVNSGGFSFSWVMLTGPGDFQVAQIGPYVSVGPTRVTAIQYSWSSTEVHQVNLAPQANGSFVYYTVDYEPTFHRHTFFVAGSQVYSVAIPQWTPGAAQISSEINTASTQMMGAVGNHENFWDNHITYGNVNHTYAGTTSNSNGNWFGQTGTAANFNVWDRSCTS